VAYAAEIQPTFYTNLATLIDAFGVVAFVAGVTIIVVFIVGRRHQERMELIRRGVNPHIHAPVIPGGNSLFWGLVCSGIGLAFLIFAWFSWEVGRSFGFGLAFFLVGGAMILYWRLTAQQAKEYQREMIAKYPVRLGPPTDVQEPPAADE
jgi:hypothetical protein